MLAPILRLLFRSSGPPSRTAQRRAAAKARAAARAGQAARESPQPEQMLRDDGGMSLVPPESDDVWWAEEFRARALAPEL
eukprot:11044128-Alexandrium_andersonii.AAC.1